VKIVQLARKIKLAISEQPGTDSEFDVRALDVVC
jgi:hypothetical protein